MEINDIKNILVFAADHRKNVKWNLPYIRLGNYQSDANLNIKDDEEIAPFQKLLSEGAQLWWLSKHIKELGNPDFIGLMHYCRFFTTVKRQKSYIINCPTELFKPQYVLNPESIKIMMMLKDLDIFTVIPNFPSNTGIFTKNAKEQLKLDIKKWNVVIPDEMIDDAFDLFFSNCKNDELKEKMEEAYTIEKAHFNANIMVVKTELLNQYIDIIVPTFKQLKTKYDNKLNQINDRAFGYILERFTSLYLYACKNIGKKVAAYPILIVKDKNQFYKYN